MSYSLPHGNITFASGEYPTSIKMSNFGKNQTDIADFLDKMVVYISSTPLDEEIGNTTNVAVSDLVRLDTNVNPVLADLVVGETAVYDAEGTVGLVVGDAGGNAVVRTISVSGGNSAKDLSVETFTIEPTDWADVSTSETYTKSYTAPITFDLTQKTAIVELFNNNIQLFTKYGFGIEAVDTTNNTITFWAVNQPEDTVVLTVGFWDTDGALQILRNPGGGASSGGGSGGGSCLTKESFTINASSWTTLSNSAPYVYQTTVLATYDMDDDTIAQLFNDQPILFAKYGFAIGSLDTTNDRITFWAADEPTENVTLSVGFQTTNCG